MRDFFVRNLLEAAPAPKSGLASSEDAHPSAGANGIARSRIAGAPAQSAASSNGHSTFDMADLNNDRSELRGVILRYVADRATQQSALPQGTRERDERGHEFAAQWLDQLGKLDFDHLSQDGKVDYLLLKNYLAHQERQLDLRARTEGSGATGSLRADDRRPGSGTARAAADGLVESGRILEQHGQDDR